VNNASVVSKGIDPGTRGYLAHFREYLEDPKM